METIEALHFRMLIDELKMQGKIYNITDFCVKIGKEKSKTAISEMLTGKRTITPDFVNVIRASFPEVNREWLLNENSLQMFVGGPLMTEEQARQGRKTQREESHSETNLLRQYLNEQSATIEAQRNTIKSLESQVKLLTEQTARLTKMLDRMTEEPLKKTHTA